MRASDPSDRRSMIRLLLAGLTALAFFACAPVEDETAPATPPTTPPPAEEPVSEMSFEPDGEPVAPAAALDYEMSNAAVPIDGVLTGGQPTMADLEKLAERGYKTVINLRTPGEDTGLEDEETAVEMLGMSYVALPVAGADGLTRENAERLAELLDGSERPLLLHCGSSNRVGGLLALEAHYVDGLDADAALELGKAAGLTRLEPAVRERLDLPVADESQ